MHILGVVDHDCVKLDDEVVGLIKRVFPQFFGEREYNFPRTKGPLKKTIIPWKSVNVIVRTFCCTLNLQLEQRVSIFTCVKKKKKIKFSLK